VAGGVFAEFFALKISAFCQPPLVRIVFLSFDGGVEVRGRTLPRMRWSAKKAQSVSEDKDEEGEIYIISKPVILQSIDILLGHCIPSAPSHSSTSPPGWNTYAVRRNLHPTISFSSSQTPIQPKGYSQLRYASSGASFILLVSHFSFHTPPAPSRNLCRTARKTYRVPKMPTNLPLKTMESPISTHSCTPFFRTADRFFNLQIRG
jgi:hypothetical protein